MVNSDTSEPPLSLGDNLNDPPRSQTYPLGASSPPSQKLHESTDSFETGDTGSEKDLSASTVDTTPSASYYLTYPVSYAMSGILRRLGSDPVVPKHGNSNHSSSYTSTLNPRASHSYSNGLDASYASSQLPSFASGTNGSSTTNDGLSGVYTPPHRHASPFEPPPLTPLSLAGYKGSTKAGARLLSRALAEEIRLLVPPRLQLVDRWALLYSLEQDGVSLGTLYGKCKEYRGKRGGFVLVVRDRGGGVSQIHAPTSFTPLQKLPPSYQATLLAFVSIIYNNWMTDLWRIPFRRPPPRPTLLRHRRVFSVARQHPARRPHARVPAAAAERGHHASRAHDDYSRAE